MECSFCKKNLSSKSALNYHQKSTKYCLELQGIKKDLYSCIHCKESFTVKMVFDRHLNSCKTKKTVYLDMLKEELEESKKNIMKLNEDIKILQNNKISLQKNIKEKTTIIEYQKLDLDKKDQQIKQLQDTIEKLATQAISRPTSTVKNTQNNYIQQLQPVTEDDMKDNAQNLTIEHILKGAQGYAEYALTYPLKDRIACVDYARRKIKFKDQDGNVITDPEMNNLSAKFFNSIKDKNTEIIIDYGNKFKDNFENNVEKILELMDYKYSVDKGAGGKKEDFHHDFIRQVCNKTIVPE
jgi:DNA repair exonuclease SbcCD ATPase subunit